MISKKAKRMLALIDRATTLWHIPVVGREKGRLIRRLIERHDCHRGIEIGSLIGYSAILIASAMPPKGRLVCVEANDFLGWMTEANAAEDVHPLLSLRPAWVHGVGRQVTVTPGEG